ncbi:MAG: hypothetical protein GY947_06915 [Rhodobacteraceae bacterium]|nr:hypothetical protein [Paracoccaceae bacterium]
MVTRILLSYWTLALVLAFVIAFLLFFNHHKIITSGEFDDFEIGATKAETLKTIFEKPNIVRVFPDRFEAVQIEQSNRSQIAKLNNQEIVRVYGTDKSS